jgi:hypothetical protein
MMDKTTRFGHGSVLHVISVQPTLKLDIQSATKGTVEVGVADATRLDDAFRRKERAGPVDSGSYEVLLYHAGPLPIAVGSRHKFRLVGAPSRGETAGPQEEFEAEVASASGPTHTLDATPQLVTLVLQVSDEVLVTPATKEVVPS